MLSVMAVAAWAGFNSGICGICDAHIVCVPLVGLLPLPPAKRDDREDGGGRRGTGGGKGVEWEGGGCERGTTYRLYLIFKVDSFLYTQYTGRDM